MLDANMAYVDVGNGESSSLIGVKTRIFDLPLTLFERRRFYRSELPEAGKQLRTLSSKLLGEA
jgi:hypothetical protein